jgi:hypothetical protein
MKRTMTSRFCVLFLWLLAAGAATAADADGVTYARNGAEPAQGRETLELEEQWRLGGFDDEDNIFGLITRVTADAEGNVYLLDTQLSQVSVFSSDGEFVRTLSREGEGPGEVRIPIDMLFMPGNDLGLVQAFPGRIVCVDLDGNPAESFVPGGDEAVQSGGFLSLSDAQCRNGHLVLGGVMSTINQDEGYQIRDHFIRSYALDGTPGVTFVNDPKKYEFGNLDIDEAEQYFPQFRKWAVSDDGHVYVAAKRAEYVIQVFAPDGALVREISRVCPNWQRTAEEKAQIDAILEAQLRNVPFPVKRSVAEDEEAINSLMLDAAGDLWVLPTLGLREQPEGVLATYDVYSPDGVFQRQVSLPMPGDPRLDGVMFAGEDRIVLVKGFSDALISLQTQGAGPNLSGDEEPAPMEVVCYRIK